MYDSHIFKICLYRLPETGPYKREFRIGHDRIFQAFFQFSNNFCRFMSEYYIFQGKVRRFRFKTSQDTKRFLHLNRYKLIKS